MFSDVHLLDIVPNFLKSDVFNIHKHIAVQTRNFEQKPVRPENISFYMFSKENPTDYIKLHKDNLNVLAKKKRKIVFFIHGWTSSRNADWYDQLKDAFLANYAAQYAIIQVDWEEPAKQFYFVSSINTYDVGECSSNLLFILKPYGM